MEPPVSRDSTTTSTSLYWMGDRAASLQEENVGTAIIDSPGFQEFGLQHIPQNQLASCMPDLKPFISSCKFYNCTHLHEPGCGVLDALKMPPSAGGMSATRYKIYSELFAELSQPRY